MARLFTCGWESGYISGTAAGSDELHGLGWGGVIQATTTVVANPAWWSSSGSYVLRRTAVTADTRNPPITIGPWIGFKWGCDALPGADTPIWTLTAGSMRILVAADGTLKLNTTAAGGLAAASAAGVLKAATCHMIEIYSVSGTQQVWVDDVLILTSNSANASDIMSTGNFAFVGPASGFFYFDDYYTNSTAASASNQTGRRGKASVRALLPNADVGSSPAGFVNSGGLTFGNATTGWFSAIDDAPPFLSSNTDFIGKNAADTVVYETAFADTPAGVVPTSVSLVSMLSGATATACQVNVSLKANAIDGSNNSYALATNSPLVGHFTLDLASSGVAWTKTLVDGATAKFGNSSDVSPNPKLYAMYLMYETADVPANTPVSSLDTNTATTESISVALPKLETLTDTFDSSLDKVAKWSASSSGAVWDLGAGGQAKIPCTTASEYIQTDHLGAYDFTGSYLLAKMTTPPVGTGTREMFMEVQRGTVVNQDKFSMGISGTTLYMRRFLAGSVSGQLTITFDAVAHLWWRIRESGGTVFFDTAPDGLTWTNQYSVASGFVVTRVWASLSADYYGTETAANAFVDNVNSAPVLVSSSDTNGTVTEATTITLSFIVYEPGSISSYQALPLTLSNYAAIPTTYATYSALQIGMLPLPQLVENAIVSLAKVGSDSGTISESTSSTVQQTSSDQSLAFVDLAAIGVKVSFADTGTITESASALTTTFVNGSDTNGTVTELGSAVAKVISADSGTTSETASTGSPVSSSDSGTLAEITSVVAQVPASDSGTAADVATAGFPINVSDTGSGSETGLLTAKVASSDGGSTSELVGVGVTISTSDSGGILAETAAIALTTGDSAGATESAALRLATVDSNGLTTESSSFSFALSNSDANGPTNETGFVSAASLVTSDVNGTTSELGSANVGAADSDSGAISESATTKAQISVSDVNGALTEFSFTQTQNQKADIDSGSDSETASLSVVGVSSDGGTISESTRIVIFVAEGADLGTAVEVISLAAKIGSGDSGTESSTADILAVRLTADSGTISETANPGLATSDTATGSVFETLIAQITSRDFGTAAANEYRRPPVLSFTSIPAGVILEMAMGDIDHPAVGEIHKRYIARGTYSSPTRGRILR